MRKRSEAHNEITQPRPGGPKCGRWDDILDGLVLSDTLNEATRAKSLLKESARLLKKSGWLAVVEWLPGDQLHGVVPGITRFAKVVNGDDIGVM